MNSQYEIKYTASYGSRWGIYLNNKLVRGGFSSKEEAEAKENITKGKSTIICGVSRPEEIMNSSEFNHTFNLRFGLIEISDSLIRKRLLTN